MDHIMFMDADFNEVDVPELYSVDEWDGLMNRTDYIYIDSYDSAVLLTTLYFKFERAPQCPFNKPGAYMWDVETEQWISIQSKIYELLMTAEKLDTTYFMTKIMNKPVEVKKDV